MSVFLILAFLFFIGSHIGWLIELFFRRFISKANPERRWINPGFCTGPYLPLYGFGLCFMYLIASLDRISIGISPMLGRIFLLFAMAAAMTAIEYIAGIFCLKVSHVRLWDYRGEKWNVQGIICPKFSFFWGMLGGGYYFLVHPHILGALEWLSQNLAFSFFIGLFFGVFIIDAANSAGVMVKLKKFADENDVVVRYEEIKSHIRRIADERKAKYSFFRPFRSDKPLHELLKEIFTALEERKK